MCYEKYWLNILEFHMTEFGKTSPYDLGEWLTQSVQWLGCGLEDRISIPDRGGKFVFMPPYPNRFWRPPRLLSNGHWWLFPQE